jgi:hypothetical protein
MRDEKLKHEDLNSSYTELLSSSDSSLLSPLSL